MVAGAAPLRYGTLWLGVYAPRKATIRNSRTIRTRSIASCGARVCS